MILGGFREYHSIYTTLIVYYAVLCYAMLYSTLLYSTLPCSTMLYYTTLHYTILYYTILYYEGSRRYSGGAAAEDLGVISREELRTVRFSKGYYIYIYIYIYTSMYVGSRRRPRPTILYYTILYYTIL